MKKTLLKRINWVFLCLIGLLGFLAISCSSIPDPDPDPVRSIPAYGIPHANFSVKSAIADMEEN